MTENNYKESQSQWWAREYMERSDGHVGETDLAIAFKAGRRAARNNLWQWCKNCAPKISPNCRVALVEFINKHDYVINTVLTTDYAAYVNTHPFVVLWAYVDTLIDPKRMSLL